MNNAIKLGLYYAAFSIAINLIVYFINAETLFTGRMLLIMTILGVGFLIFMGRKMLRDPEDILSYGAAVKYLFVAVLIGGAISNIFAIAMYSNNEKMMQYFEEYSYRSGEAAVRMTSSIAGATDAEKQEAVEKWREAYENDEVPRSPYPFAWSMFPLNMVSLVVMGLIYALLGAIFVRQKTPS